MKDALGELHPSRLVARRMHELETELQRARMHMRRHSKSPDTLGRWGLEQPAAAQQEEGWFLTYLDMMTLLLVVMIVMLAFSGSLGKPREAETPPAVAAVAIAGEEDAAPMPNAAPEPQHPAAPTPAPPTAPSVAAAEESPAASESEPDAPPAVPAPVTAGIPVVIPPVPFDLPASYSTAALYPGWSAADLAASFIGPPRPGITDTTPAVPGAMGPDEAGAASAAAVAPSEPAADEPRSEGETLAAGLSLGELGNDVQVVVHERSVSFRVNSEILFDSSQADLSRSGLSILRRIVEVLSETGHEVTVEGHTDAVPVRRNVRYPSNWELSSARAGSVVRYLQANGIDGARLKAIGYADTRPIGDNHTPEGRASNRRVELVIEKRD